MVTVPKAGKNEQEKMVPNEKVHKAMMKRQGGSRGALEEVHRINQVVRRQAERRNMEKSFKRHPYPHNKREKTLPTDPSGTGKQNRDCLPVYEDELGDREQAWER